MKHDKTLRCGTVIEIDLATSNEDENAVPNVQKYTLRCLKIWHMNTNHKFVTPQGSELEVQY